MEIRPGQEIKTPPIKSPIIKPVEKIEPQKPIDNQDNPYKDPNKGKFIDSKA
jgi:hypothetical protein